jgi:hypothetical protein
MQRVELRVDVAIVFKLPERRRQDLYISWVRAESVE